MKLYHLVEEPEAELALCHSTSSEVQALASVISRIRGRVQPAHGIVAEANVL